MISRGSEWRKWNLHMHSEYSRENRTKMKITEIFDSAVKNNISMISITDHSNFDALDEIWDIYQNGMCEQGHYSDIVDFLPGIELKTDKGKKGVHIISIFPKEIVVNRNTKQATKSVLYDNFCTKLGLSYSEIESNGDGDYAKGLLCSIVDFDRAVNLTHELGGVVIIHGGDKHGSIEEEMAHANSKEPTPEELYESLDITKTEIISSKIDIIELPNFERRQAKNAHFYNSVFLKPCMVASDAHEKSEYDVLGEKITWVEDEQNGLKVQLKQKISVKESIVAEENRNIQLYDAYIKEYQEWEKVKKEKEEAVNKINEELLYISDGIMIDLQPLYEKRQNITASIFNEKKKVIELYNKFKKPVDEFLRDKADLLSEYSISIRSGLVINEMFQEEVFSYINKQKKNAFRDDNYQLTKTVDALAEMDDIEQYIAIPNKIIKKMKDYDNENIVSSQLKDNKWLEFYNYLFGLQYIQNKYELVSDNKTLEKLSPGERGALLLIFYLLLDLRDIPLVIDQPEDNLDNQSVASILVPFIQAAKKRRQIILVTHNPNLAVVADSDQIVHVKINKEERNLVEVKSGGIENTEINDSIVTILEGTMLSFRKRDEKYIDK